MRSFIHYAQFNDFWERLEPLTPYGKDVKGEQRFYTDISELEKLWQNSERASALLDLPHVTAHRLRYFLKRLPRFRGSALSVYDEADLFEYKKFLTNYRQLSELLPADIRAYFGLEFQSHALEATLSKGDQYAETFYIADAYDSELAEVRASIRTLDIERQEAQQRLLDEITKRFSLTFNADFAVVERKSFPPESLSGANALLTLEPYDENHYLARPQLPGTILAMQEQRQNLISRERSLEARVIAEISLEVSAALPQLIIYRDRVCAFDMALARAQLARQYHLVRPLLNATPAEPMRVIQGRFLPCQEHCERTGRAYIPLDWGLGAAHNVLFGSNMGGKTIALKTLAFLQMCVQTGLYVPVQEFRTCLFKHCHYIGEGRCDTPQQGLSGFGYEMSQFCEAYDHCTEPTLILFDEFARTTNSREAEALISAILRDFSDRDQVRTVFSSHFHGIERLERVAFFKMRGLQESAEQPALNAESASPLERLQRLNGLIDYRIQPDPVAMQSSDALKIAALLGVPQRIVEWAEAGLTARK